MILSKESAKAKIEAILRDNASNFYARVFLSKKVAEKSLLMRHLYQDLGFSSRAEMGKFMQTNFYSLSAQKPKSVRWKKFLFDLISDVAPACENCRDSDNCFSCELKVAN